VVEIVMIVLLFVWTRRRVTSDKYGNC